ncbi:hypothetical protein D9M68_897480 [compost metagenome]
MPSLAGVELDTQHSQRIHAKAQGSLREAGLIVQLEPLSPFFRFRRRIGTFTVIAIEIEVPESEVQLAVTDEIGLCINSDHRPQGWDQNM